jgi:hypothetical protein
MIGTYVHYNHPNSGWPKILVPGVSSFTIQVKTFCKSQCQEVTCKLWLFLRIWAKPTWTLLRLCFDLGLPHKSPPTRPPTHTHKLQLWQWSHGALNFIKPLESPVNAKFWNSLWSLLSYYKDTQKNLVSMKDFSKTFQIIASSFFS